MKGSILYTNFDNETNISTVTKQTKYGTFTCSVKVHSDDFDIMNEYDGYHFAEMKCDIAAYREKAQYMKQRAIGIEHAYNVLFDSCNENDPVMEKLWRQVNVAYWNYESALHTYQILKESYPALIQNILMQRRELRAKIEKRRERLKEIIENTEN